MLGKRLIGTYRPPKRLILVGAVWLCLVAFVVGMCMWVMAWYLPYRNRLADVNSDGSVRQFRHNEQRWGAQDDVDARAYALDWVVGPFNDGLYGASKSTPAVDAAMGALYVGSDRGELLAIDRVDGSVMWRFRGEESRKGIHGSPAVGRKAVFYGDYAGIVYAVDRRSGRELWRQRVGNWVGSSVLLMTDNAPNSYGDFGEKLYVSVELSGPRGMLIVLSGNTGAEVFRSPTIPDYCHSSPAYDPDNRRVVFGDNSAAVYSFDATAPAAPVWTVNLGKGGDVKSTPAVALGLVFVSSWDHHIYALRATDGQEVWRFDTGAKSMSSPAVNPGLDMLVVGSSNGMVYGIRPRNGSLVWSTYVGGNVMSSPTITYPAYVAIVGSSNYAAYLLNLEDGRIIQTLRLYSALTSIPVPISDHLYLFDHSGYLYAYSKKS